MLEALERGLARECGESSWILGGSPLEGNSYRLDGSGFYPHSNPLPAREKEWVRDEVARRENKVKDSSAFV